MIYPFQVRHSGMDSLRAFLPVALQVKANSFQTNLCRTNSPGANWDVRRTGRSPNRREAVSNPGPMDGFELTILGTG
ncbi:MAG: hypothetical protein PHY16_01215 [Methylobacter sp.]|nr:hypothetical protein [Methylobacter sp.]